MTIKRRVRRAYRAGTRLDLAGRTVDAAFLAGLLREPGRLDLAGARITGALDLTGARIEAPVHLRRCVFERELRLDHAELLSVNLDECALPGIEADGLRVAGDFAGRDMTVGGDIWMLPARIDGTVELDRSVVQGSIYLQRAEVGGGVIIRDATVGKGLRLAGSRVGGNVDLTRSKCGAAADTGAAVNAGGMVVGGGFFSHDLVADGEVNLIGTRVAGSITLQRAVLRGREGRHALLLIETQARMLTLRPAPESAGTISLRDARVGRLVDDPVNWPAGCRVELDGLTYERLTRRSEDVDGWTAGQRLDWMARFTTGAALGPYDQLAAALRRDGREQEARQVLVVRERLRHRAKGRLGALWGAVQNVTIGFGYRPGRALLWLLAVVAASTGWFAWSGPLRAVKPDESPTWDPFLYSVDVLVPLVDLGHDKAWDPVGADKAVTLAVMAAGWILATTVVAGAGRAINRGGQ
ncbi:hypothetical protein FHR83_006226 [Actinoplanes campanulatus]|uniref:Membrane-associated oxidoreductase n=1 Tax=Actinoplanes campanulatus TaxID=113559 RepID=A0A7W5AM17_9ACTN|nr:hypothetical protein [Actinoplanes campanulatus]MBB3098527.1 hypothetical protein [Actinoplanes campanulatus]GGN35729.1 hypothetical protein GCM10010109_59980 [Actinoplanes campanulatus]GID39221.1 hypothetical protein Aca09nite_57270 [Actinoplanes campanulatus]